MWPDIAAPLIGMGCMRLSTEADRDERQAITVIHSALDAGVTLLDAADAYCWNDTETGHNERLIAQALQTWTGDGSRILVATKGGLTRPNGAWEPDGRARHLASACEASCRALNVDRIELYQLHATDPRTPLATSVRALASLQRDGLVCHVGLCNVTVRQIEESRAITEIAAVQVELNIWNEANFLSGVVDYCARHDIRVIASRPLGGAARNGKFEKNPVLAGVARRHEVSSFDMALAWLADVSPAIVTIPGPTRTAHAAGLGRAAHVRLTDEDREALGALNPAAAHVRTGPRRRSVAAGPKDGEIVLIMGLPAAGKSTIAREFVERGYTRLNRDASGGSLKALLPALHDAIERGATRIVLDNTYVSRKMRAAVIQSASATGLGVRCVWLATSIEDAQVNAASRMLARYGRLLGPDEMKQAVKRDVSAFGPGVQFRYQRELEPPDSSEGFSDIQRLEFTRHRDPSFTNRALLVWCDDVLTEQPERVLALERYSAEGWTVLGIGWQPQPADDVYERLRQRVGVPIAIEYCPHGGGPPVCWCRKPLPGLGVVFIDRYKLDPSRCLYVGGGPQDPGFARRLGFPYRDADEFFGVVRSRQ